jgi:hypothetical protein
MTKQEFLVRIEKEKPLKDSPVRIKVGKLVNSPYIIGCYQDNGLWKIYETEERGGYFIIKEFTDENEAFDFLYRVIYNEKKMDDYIKQQGI